MVAAQQRFSKAHPCPICHGYDQARRRHGERCYGFLSANGQVAHCTNDAFGGNLPKNLKSDTYPHRLVGDCRCGVRHDPSPPRPTPRRSGGKRHKSESRRIVDTYDYTDGLGQLWYQVVRYDPKGFSQRQPDGHGGWINHMIGVSPLLYHFPEVKAAIAAGQLICVAEGEADVEALRPHGYTATCNSGGALKWRETHSTDLKGAADVVLFEDNDKKGHEHVAKVNQSLRAVGITPRLARLEGLPEGGDIRNWLQTHTQEDLARVIAEAAPIALETSPQGRPVVVTMSDVQAEAVEWLWWPYVAVGKLCMLDGDPGIGKSLLMTQLAARLSVRDPLPNQQGKPSLHTGGPHATLLLTAEDGLADTLKPRLEQAGADCRKIHVLKGWLGSEDEVRAFTLRDIDVLQEALQQYRPRLVVIDPIQAYLGDIDMHRANETRPLLAKLTRLAEEYRCAIVCIRHPSKPGQGGGKVIHRGLGSIDFIGAARTGLYVEQHPVDVHKVLLLHIKSNIGPRGRTQVYSKADGVFEWCAASRLTVEILEGSGRGPDPYRFFEVFCWIEAHIRPGIPRPSKELEDELGEGGYGRETIARAKKALGIQSFRQADTWFWRIAFR